MLVFRLAHSDKHAGANLMRFRLYSTSVTPVGPPASLPDDLRPMLLTTAGKRDAKQRARLKEHYQSIAPELKEVRVALAAARKEEKELNDAIPIKPQMRTFFNSCNPSEFLL